MPSFHASRLDRAFSLVDRAVESGRLPGAVAAVGGTEGPVVVHAYGWAALEPEPVPMRSDTLFDLASLTKVVATTPAVLRLLEEGAFVLETPVRHILPDFSDPRVTIRHLLTHTSGLPAWQPLYLEHRGWEAYTQAICATPLVRDPGARVEYSDLGFMLLGAIIHQVTGMSLPDYCRTAVFEPLGMSETGWLPAVPRERIAATERGNQVEYGMCGDQAAQFPRWRDDVIWGEVNDGNAYYGLDGVSSHAGLFGTAQDLVKYAQCWLRGGEPLFSGRTAGLAGSQSHTRGLNENRGLGWKKKPFDNFPNGRAFCGDLVSDVGFGHTGFTGTSLWMEPAGELFIILLTNRLHPVSSSYLDTVRPAFHNAVMAAVL